MVTKGTTSRLTKRVTKSLTADGASGVSGPADIRAAVGTSTSPTSIGTKSVTGVGFQPKVVMPFGAQASADGAAIASVLGFGSGVSTSSRAAIAAYSTFSLTTSNTDRRHTNAACFTSLASSGVYEEADLNSLDSDGFTLDWGAVHGAELILNHICLGGDDLEVSLTQHQMNGTNADESFAHGLTGGAPDALLFFGVFRLSASPGTETRLFWSLGAWGASSQFVANAYSQDGATTTLTRRRLGADAVCSVMSNSYVRAMAVDSVNAANVNCSYPTQLIASQAYFHMLALRGCKAQVGTFDCNGSTDPLTISCSGITPKLFLPVMMPFGVDNINTVQTGNAFSIGASDGTNTASCGIIDRNNVATTTSRRFQDSTGVSEYDFDGTLESDSAVSFSGESVVFDPSTNTGTAWGQGGYLIIGA